MGLFSKKPAGPPGQQFTKEQLAHLFKALVRADPDRPCPWCNQSLGPSKGHCNFCGKPVPRPLCLHCGNPLIAGVQFCSRCGKRFDPAEVMGAALAKVPALKE